jgi:valyl-tRNA synthetase
MARLKDVREANAGQGVRLTDTKYNCWLDIDEGPINRYIEKMSLKEAQQRGLIKQLEARLSNKKYLEKAPKELVVETKRQLHLLREQLEALLDEKERFNR